MFLKDVYIHLGGKLVVTINIILKVIIVLHNQNVQADYYDNYTNGKYNISYKYQEEIRKNMKLFQHYRELRDDLKKSIQQSVSDEIEFHLQLKDKQTFISACQQEMASRQLVNDIHKSIEQLKKNKLPDTEIEILQERLQNETADLKSCEEHTISAAIPLLNCIFHLPILQGAIDEIFGTFIILTESSPKGLALFSDSGADNIKKDLVDRLLSNPQLMLDMLFAGGAKKGNYGKAMEILDSIIRSSSHVSTQPKNLFYEMALGTCLEHSEPVNVFKTDIKIDPVIRYLHYEEAYLNKELDPACSNMTAWDYRWVTNGDATDEEAKWCREMIRNYRPDFVLMKNYDWRYCNIVRSDVRYKAPEWKSLPHTYQQLISGGGKCGPRAWFGRFACKSFGIPTWGVRQPGHAAMSHWTPEGWVICLGGGSRENLFGGWHQSHWEQRNAVDFLMEAEARMFGDFKPVLRLKWIGCAFSEEPKNGFDLSCFWHSLALMQSRLMCKEFQSSLSQQNTSAKQALVIDWFSRLSPIEYEGRHSSIHTKSNGQIMIPAACCCQKNVNTFTSFDRSYDGRQIHLNKDSKLEFKLDIPKEGVFYLSAKVATVHEVQYPFIISLGNVSVLKEDTDKWSRIVEMDIPYTIGEWENTRPIKLNCRAGTHYLTIASDARSPGIAVKYFTLIPDE